MITVNGTIIAPAPPEPIRTHTVPDSVPNTGEHTSGAVYSNGFGPYHNTGNVDQTLTVAATHEVNINITGLTLMVDGIDLGSTTAILAPAKSAYAMVSSTLAPLPDGVPSETFSFELDDTWS